MLDSISWQTFLVTCLLLVGVYYIVILFFSRKDKDHNTKEKGKTDLLASRTSEKEDKEFENASALKLSLLEVFSLASSRQWIKQELLSGLAARLQIYSHLQDTPYQHAIENFIIKEATEQLRIPLTREEVSSLW